MARAVAGPNATTLALRVLLRRTSAIPSLSETSATSSESASDARHMVSIRKRIRASSRLPYRLLSQVARSDRT